MILYDYERKDSPYVHIKFGTCAHDAKIIKTTIRKTDKDRKRKVAAELNRIERQLIPFISSNGSAPIKNGDGWKWCDGYIQARYAEQPTTRDAYLQRWKIIRLFLTETEVESPAALNRETVFEYQGWRLEQVKEKSRRTPKLSTIVGELKLLAMIMDEAVKRKAATDNPARDLNIRIGETPMRPEITDEMLAVIWPALQKKPEWMRKSFFLALNTGLRFQETRIHRSQIRTASDDILIEKPKGGRKREFAIPIYDSIRPMINAFLKSKDEYIWTCPGGAGWKSLPGLQWSQFLHRSSAYVPGLCFHSTRVTFISRGMRGNPDGTGKIPEHVMMKMVNHASKDISRIYQRVTSEDVRRFANQIPVPTLAVARA